MLVAEALGTRIEAALADRGPDYNCPGCKASVNLKHGRIVIPHFAHAKNSTCDFSIGETVAHLQAKARICQTLRNRGIAAYLEVVVHSTLGDRRCDIMAISPSGKRIAIEVQHTAIGLDQIIERSFSYAKARIAQFWCPVKYFGFSDNDVERHRPHSVTHALTTSPYIRWVHGLYFGHIWLFDSCDQTMWYATLGNHYLESGRISKRFKTYYLVGPYNPNELRLSISYRDKTELGVYEWPAGYLADFHVPGDVAMNTTVPRA